MHALNHEWLRCFVCVAETGNFTSAGDQLGLSQPGVSMRIRKLEQYLGKPLLLRNRGAVRVTREGEVLLDYARRMLNLNREIVDYFLTPDLAGELRVGIVEYVAHTSLQPLLRHFRQIYPRLRLEVTVGLGIDLLPKFRAGALDVVISGTGEAEELAQPLYDERLVWCCAPDDAPPPADRPLPLLSLPDPCSHRGAGTSALASIGRDWEQIYTSTNMSSLKAAVAAGLGVAILPASVVDASLHRLGPEDGFPDLPLSQIGAYRQPGDDPAVDAFLSFYLESRG